MTLSEFVTAAGSAELLALLVVLVVTARGRNGPIRLDLPRAARARPEQREAA